MAITITEVLNIWNEQGVFSYVIPFLLIFAVVFAILDKTRLLSGKKSEGGNENRPLLAIIAASVGLLALQFDIVSEFFSVIFPGFGIGLSIFLVLLILLGFFIPEEGGRFSGSMKWIGWLTGIGVVVWALASWETWRGYSGFGLGYWGLGYWLQDYFWALIILAIVIFVVAGTARGDRRSGRGDRRGGRGDRRGGRGG